MTTKELFNNIMAYRQVNRAPTIVFEHFEVSTLERWRAEGLPAGQTPMDYLNMDKLVHLPVSFLPVPEYGSRVISEDDRSFINIDIMGSTVRRLKKNPTMYYGYIDYPIKNRDDWMRYRERFDPSSQERLPADDVLTKLNNSGDLLMLHFFPFFFRLGFYSMGMERFMTAFYDMPGLIHEMFSFWSRFVLETVKPVLSRAKIDLAVCTEDSAYKNGPHLSPQIYREFFIPYQNIIVNELKKNGINIFGLWTAGNIDAYIPILMENGVNCLLILERQAGMDPNRVRKEFGKELLLIGGIAKEALIEGPGALDREIEKLMPIIEQGGYIPAIDDMIPPEVPFSHYIHYVKKMQQLKL